MSIKIIGEYFTAIFSCGFLKIWKEEKMVKNVIINNIYIINPLLLAEKVIQNRGIFIKMKIFKDNIFEQVFNIQRQEIDAWGWYNDIVINLSCVIIVKMIGG
jgi:hypothetical protein